MFEVFIGLLGLLEGLTLGLIERERSLSLGDYLTLELVPNPKKFLTLLLNPRVVFGVCGSGYKKDVSDSLIRTVELKFVPLPSPLGYSGS